MIVLVFCTLVGGSLWMLLALLTSGESLQWDLMRNDSILQMAHLIVAATLATAYLYQTTTVVLGPTRVNAYFYLNPALIATLLLVIDGEPIAIAIMPGILISVVATVLLQQSKATEVTVKPKASG